MPTYVYRFVDTDETIEIQQSFSDPTLTEFVHPTSGATLPVKKVFLPVGVTFKGDGFYKTDSRASKKAKSSGSESKDATTSSTDSSKDSSSKDSSSKDSSSKDSSSKDSSSKQPTESSSKDSKVASKAAGSSGSTSGTAAAS